MKRLLILPSDERQEYVMKFLKKKGYKCKLYSKKNNLKKEKAVVLPIPSVVNGIINSNSISYEEFVESLDKNCVVFAFCVKDTDFADLMEENNIRYFDCYLCEELAQKNAYATAQGILKYILLETKTMLYKKRILISGYGRTGKAICNYLHALGADITVVVRRRKYINMLKRQNIKGVFYEDLKQDKINFDYLINTVAVRVIDRDIIENLNIDCKILEIASKPYGIDFKEARKKDIKVEILPSLPSKAAPESAGEFIADTIDNIIKEENLWK